MSTSMCNMTGLRVTFIVYDLVHFHLLGGKFVRCKGSSIKDVTLVDACLVG